MIEKESDHIRQEERVNHFVDAEGFKWHPVFSTSVLFNACRACCITIPRIMQLDIEVADIFELVWQACKKQATKAGVRNQDEFFDRIPPNIWPDVTKAIFGCLYEAFPDMASAAEDRMKKSGKLQGFIDPGKK